jgi:hypothetical protein
MWLVFNSYGRLVETLPASTTDDEVLARLEALRPHHRSFRAELWQPGAKRRTRRLPVSTYFHDDGTPKYRSATSRTGFMPRCTCHVRLATGRCLPDCPRGLATDNRYATWDDVPNDVLSADRYEAKYGHPPPKCPQGCGHDLFECEPCRFCYCDEHGHLPPVGLPGYTPPWVTR